MKEPGGPQRGASRYVMHLCSTSFDFGDSQPLARTAPSRVAGCYSPSPFGPPEDRLHQQEPRRRTQKRNYLRTTSLSVPDCAPQSSPGLPNSCLTSAPGDGRAKLRNVSVAGSNPTNALDAKSVSHTRSRESM